MSFTNKNLIEQFSTLRKYFQEKGDKGRVIAYSKAIVALRSIDEPITSVKQLKGIRGIGPKVTEKVQEFLNKGIVGVSEKAKKEMKSEEKPKTKKDLVLEEFQTIWGIGPVKAKKLYEAENIHSLKQLEKNTHLLTDQQRIGLKYREDLLKKIPRTLITAINVIMVYYMNKEFGKGTYKLKIAGSYRRGASQSGDIDCLITSDNGIIEDVVKLLKRKGLIVSVLGMKKEKFMGIAHCGDFYFRLDIEFVKKEEWGSSLLYFTGSKEFNVYMRAEARRKGMLLNEHGLFKTKDTELDKKIEEAPTEKRIFELIGLKYIPPERR